MRAFREKKKVKPQGSTTKTVLDRKASGWNRGNQGGHKSTRLSVNGHHAPYSVGNVSSTSFFSFFLPWLRAKSSKQDRANISSISRYAKMCMTTL
jgi:hypothetical protein